MNAPKSFFAADAMSAVVEARKTQPDLIILDLGLPAGDGFVVMERFRANLQLSMIPNHRCVWERHAYKQGSRP